MTGYLLVALGGAVGAPLRFLVDRWVTARHRTGLAWGTAAVNVVGSLLLGALIGAAAPADMTLLLGTGFCGALTTWSTCAVETVQQFRSGARIAAVLSVTGTVAAGMAAAALGYAVGVGVSPG